MKIEYRELKVNNYTIRGYLTSPDQGFKQIICMFHGFTGHHNENGFLFKQLTNALVSDGFATLRYDYMGSGDSDGDFSDQNFNTVLADAKAVLLEGYKLNGNKPVIVLGFSMGGATCGRLCAECGDYIEKAVLMSPAGDMLGCISTKFPDGSTCKVADLGGYYISVDFKHSFENRDLYAGCETFKKPVLITQGSADLSVFPSVSWKYTTYFENWQYALVMGASHCYTKVEYRKEVITLIRDYLRRTK